MVVVGQSIEIHDTNTSIRAASPNPNTECVELNWNEFPISFHVRAAHIALECHRPAMQSASINGQIRIKRHKQTQLSACNLCTIDGLNDLKCHERFAFLRVFFFFALFSSVCPLLGISWFQLWKYRRKRKMNRIKLESFCARIPDLRQVEVRVTQPHNWIIRRNVPKNGVWK